MAMKYHVYTLSYQGVPFYVGKGTGSRMYAHKLQAMRSSKNTPLYNKIRKIVKGDETIEYERVHLTDSNEVAYEYEVQLIAEIGRKDLGTGPLLNLTEGGEGVRSYVWTAEHRQRQSESLKKAHEAGNIKHRLGFFGEHPEVSSETRKKLSASGKAYYKTPAGIAQRKQQSLKTKGKKRVLSDEARQRMRDSALRTNRMKRDTL